MSLRKTDKSPYWQYEIDLTVDGKRYRFSGTTKCTERREGEKVEVAVKAAKLAEIRSSKTAEATLPLGAACKRYWEEKGQHHAGADNTKRDLLRLAEYFGIDKSMHAITDKDVTGMVAWRRSHRVRRDPKAKLADCPLIAPATVNRSTTEVLKKVFTYAKQNWGARFDHEPIWQNHFLKEPRERVRELRDDEAEKISATMRDDYAPFFAFIHATGLRWNREARTLRWSDVDWGARRIKMTGKGGEPVVIPIRPKVREILWPLIGHHPDFVFTYQAQRTRDGRVEGQRYPLTLNGTKTRWRRMRNQAGVTGFRMHDYRHDFATKLLRETGNLKLTSRALNHASVATTAKYAHVADQDVASALEAFDTAQKSRESSRESIPGKQKGSAKQ